MLRALVYGYPICVEFSLRSPRSLWFNYTLEVKDLRHRSKMLLYPTRGTDSVSDVDGGVWESWGFGLGRCPKTRESSQNDRRFEGPVQVSDRF